MTYPAPVQAAITYLETWAAHHRDSAAECSEMTTWDTNQQYPQKIADLNSAAREHQRVAQHLTTAAQHIRETAFQTGGDLFQEAPCQP